MMRFKSLLIGVLIVKIVSGAPLAVFQTFDNCTDSDSEVTTGVRVIGPAVGRSRLANKVDFSPLPKDREYPTARLAVRASDFNPYGYVKRVLHVFHPATFPTDFLMESLRENVSTVNLSLKALEVEFGLLSCLVLFLMLSLVVPAFVLSLCSTTPQPPPTCAPNCKRRTLVFVLNLLLMLLLLGCCGMIWTNEECSRGMSSSPDFVKEMIKDVKTFVNDSTRKIRHLLTDSYDEAVAPLLHDLNDTENLLGRPLQIELVLETGIDSALDSLLQIAAGAKEVCSIVADVMRTAVKADQTLTLTRRRVDELRDQMSVVRKTCQGVDRILCDTVSPQFIEIKFSTKTVLNSSHLNYLNQAGVDTLSSSILEASTMFSNLPASVERKTRISRFSIEKEIQSSRVILSKSAASFKQLTTRSNSKLDEIRLDILPYFEYFQLTDYWRWLIGLVASMTVLYSWALLMGANCCGCCCSEKTSQPTLIVSLIIIAIVSVFLWFVSYLTLFAGAHGENFVCKVLNGNGNTYALSRVIDSLSDPKRSFVSQILYNGTDLNLSLGGVMRDCSHEDSAYDALKIAHFVNVTDLVNDTAINILEQFREIHSDLLGDEIFNSKLLSKLSELNNGLSFNVTRTRAQLVGPVSSDIEVLTDHLKTISRQIKDSATAIRLESIATRSKRVLSNLIHELESSKENLVFHLTALEIKITPLLVQINQSIAHIKAVQYYINTQGSSLAFQGLRTYKARLQNYLEQYQDHVAAKIISSETSCRSLWSIFEAFTVLFCRQTLDPLNGFWFTTVYCLTLFIVITPVCLKLIEFYGQTSSTPAEV